VDLEKVRKVLVYQVSHLCGHHFPTAFRWGEWNEWQNDGVSGLCTRTRRGHLRAEIQWMTGKI
jgi:hypothetical protein